ncbi:MAG: ABC-three component system protein [Nitrosopumilaceae archaeon]
MFVNQLNIIMLRQPRIKKAITDYYKAYNQRSRWVREKLVFLNELSEYESQLIDEWERYFFKVDEGLRSTPTEGELVSAGRTIFDWMDTQADFCIRKYCTEPYVMRGTYHILANKLRVGWHPKFLERLQELLSPDSEKHYGTTERASN